MKKKNAFKNKINTEPVSQIAPHVDYALTVTGVMEVLFNGLPSKKYVVPDLVVDLVWLQHMSHFKQSVNDN